MNAAIPSEAIVTSAVILGGALLLYLIEGARRGWAWLCDLAERRREE